MKELMFYYQLIFFMRRNGETWKQHVKGYLRDLKFNFAIGMQLNYKKKERTDSCLLQIPCHIMIFRALVTTTQKIMSKQVA